MDFTCSNTLNQYDLLMDNNAFFVAEKSAEKKVAKEEKAVKEEKAKRT